MNRTLALFCPLQQQDTVFGQTYLALNFPLIDFPLATCSGDVVICSRPVDPTENIIKRVVALEHEQVGEERSG